MSLWFFAFTMAFAAPTFPSVVGEDLSGTVRHFPEEVATERTVVLLGFQRKHQSDMDTWLPLVRQLAESPDLEWLEMPFMGELGSWTQSFLRTVLRGQIRDAASRSRTLPVFEDSDAARRVLGIESTAASVLLVIDQEGEVIGRVMGARTSTGEAKLRSLLVP